MKSSVACSLLLAAMVPEIASAATRLYNSDGATSTYVYDWAQGAGYTNYAFLASTSAYVGNWRVDQGPAWSAEPVVYSGVEAAALLFGGSSADYFTSTVDSIAAHADYQAWASIYGNVCVEFARCGVKVDQGLPTRPVVAPPTEPVAPIPEPKIWVLMVVGFGLVGARRRRQAAVPNLA